MKSWTKPTPEVVAQALSHLRDVERRYFFSRLNNPLWIDALDAKACFSRPPNPIKTEQGSVSFPGWPELTYLVRMTDEAPERVVEILKKLPKTDNPSVYWEIIGAVTKITSPKLAAALRGKVLEATSLPYRVSGHLFPAVIAHWARLGPECWPSALELTAALVSFQPDPKMVEKNERRKANAQDFLAVLEPTPKVDEWEYIEILEKGVKPLAALSPLQTASVLKDAVAEMLRLSFPERVDENKWADYSEIWCVRVDEASREHKDSKESLVHTLTFACKKVYEHQPDSIAFLDKILRVEPWDIFTRIRQHLYADHLNNQTFPWIREAILNHDDFGTWDIHFDFQRMIRKACENFGPALLTPAEGDKIFSQILAGPPKEQYKEFLGERYTNEDFVRRQNYFHLKQLKPFESVLFGVYLEHYQQLAKIENKKLTDNDYSPYISEGARTVETRSPKAPTELAALKDDELVTFLNTWQGAHRDSESWWIETNFDGLGSALQHLITENYDRFASWNERWLEIQRPFYFRYILSAATKQILAKPDTDLEIWFKLCYWILSQKETPVTSDEKRSDLSVQTPCWRSSRRAVADFVGACVGKDSNVPVSWRKPIAQLLANLCVGYDRMDIGERILTSHNEPFTEAINATRGIALEDLVDYGWWVRKAEGESAAVPEIGEILAKRFAGEPPLTAPEYALLGSQFVRIFALDNDWMIKNASGFFPRSKPAEWKAAFGTYLTYSRPYGAAYKLIEGELKYALENVSGLKDEKNRSDPVKELGEHLFTYYVWNHYSLNGSDSLLAEYYKRTNDDYWAHLFDHVGRSLRNSSPSLDGEIKDRIMKFFASRLAVKNSKELQEFTFWLEAECLDPKWRLESYSKILDATSEVDAQMMLRIETLRKLLTTNPDLVVECFAKLIKTASQREHFYIQSEEATPILSYGLNSTNSKTKAAAEAARENLLKLGRFEFLDVK